MASGDTLSRFDPRQNMQPSSGGATFLTRNLHPLYEFADGSDTTVVFQDTLDRRYSGGGITAYVHWCAKTVTTGNGIWMGDFENNSDQDIDSDGFTGSPQSATSACNATCGKETVTSIAFTNGAQIDSIAVGNLFRFKLTRDGDNASDTLSDVAQLLWVELKET